MNRIKRIIQIALALLITFFSAHAQSYDLYGVWSKRAVYGSGGSASIATTEVDDHDNIYVAGTFTGTLNFSDDICNPVMRTATAGGSSFLIKYNNIGQYQWDVITKNVQGTVVSAGVGPLHYDNGRILFSSMYLREYGIPITTDIFTGSKYTKRVTKGSIDGVSSNNRIYQWIIQVVDTLDGRLQATIDNFPTGTAYLPSPRFVGNTIFAAHYGTASVYANAVGATAGSKNSAIASFQLINNSDNYTVNYFNRNYPNQPLSQHPARCDGSRVCRNITLPNGKQITMHHAHDYTLSTGGSGTPAYYVMSYSNDFNTHNRTIFLSDMAIDHMYRPFVIGDASSNVLIMTNVGHSKFWNTQTDVPNSNFINNYAGSGLNITTRAQYNKIALAKVSDNLVYNSAQGSWAIQIGTTGAAGTDMVYGSDIKVVNNVIYITGKFKGTNVPFGNGRTLTSNGTNFDGFYAAYNNSNGACLYAVNMGGVNDEDFTTVYLSPDAQHVLIGGNYNSPIFQTDPAARLYALSSNGTTSQGFITWYTTDQNEPPAYYNSSYGDAPSSYGVAVHHAYECLRLGGLNFAQLQSVPQHSVNANTAQNDDGIAISYTTGHTVNLSSSNFNLNAAGHLSVTVNVYNSTLESARLVGWIDFNQNGVFDSASEASGIITVNANEKNVPKTLTWSNANTKMLDGATYMRLRITTDGIDQTQPQGLFFNGEVEDFRVDFDLLSIEKTFVTTNSNPTTANVGDEITYTLKLVNNTPAPINSIVLFDPIPDSTSYIANSAMKGSTLSGTVQTVNVNGQNKSAVVWPAFNLAAGATSDLYTFKVRLNDKPQLSDTIYNTAYTRLSTSDTILSNTVKTRVNHVEAFDDLARALENNPININVLSNDYFLPYCATTIAPVIIKQPVNGTASVNPDKTIAYTGSLGPDTLVYSISCGSETDTATVYIIVTEKPDNISDAECFIDPPPTNFTISETKRSSLTYMYAQIGRASCRERV